MGQVVGRLMKNSYFCSPIKNIVLSNIISIVNTQYESEFSRSIIRSREEAKRLNSHVIKAEHLVLGIIKENNNRASDLIRRLCAKVDAIVFQLEVHVSTVILSQQVADGYAMDSSASRAMRDCIKEAVSRNRKTIGVEHLLLAILSNKESGACQILNENGITYDVVSEALNQEVASLDEDSLHFDDSDDDDDVVPPNVGNTARVEEETTSDKSTTPYLDKFGHDLTQMAREGKLDSCIGRDEEIQRIAQILNRRRKNNPILIGEPGVGKTAIVEGLAARIVSMQVPVSLLDKRIISLDMPSLVAGTKFRGQFEERLMHLVKELESHSELILFIDEIHTLIGAGSAAGSMDAANILKPFLSRGVLQCIGATTIEEYRKTIEKDGAMDRRFQKVMVRANTSEETLSILCAVKEKYEKHHHVTYTDEALQACVHLTDRYISDRSQPDKALDALDESGSRSQAGITSLPPSLSVLNKRLQEAVQAKEEAVAREDYEEAMRQRDTITACKEAISQEKARWESQVRQEHHAVTLADVENTVSLMSGIPVQRMASAESVRIKGLHNALLANVIQQDEAVDCLVQAIMRNRIGVRDPHRPIGTFLFTGPTGVGKTYLAQCLAEHLFGSKEALIRIDMSEYMEKHASSRLVGAPPGYVGYEEGGQLTEKVRRRPYSVVLLDEIEKASSSIFNLLLQVMDEGRLTDSAGVTVDFRHTVIIMTSNCGTREASEFAHPLGFVSPANANVDSFMRESEQINRALRKHFTPEFRNRIDEVITFRPLLKDSIRKIARLEMHRLENSIKELGYGLHYSPSVLSFLAEKGYSAEYGARPLKRVIQHYIENGLGTLIMDSSLSAGHTIKISKKPGSDELLFK